MKKRNNDYLKPVVSNVDPDMSREALASYMLDYPDFMETSFKCKEGFRGDTLQSCGWTFGKENKFAEQFNSKSRSYSPLFTPEEIKIINQFRRGYHCKANFALMLGEHNLWRGGFKAGFNDNYGKGQCDYFDIYLNLIRSYYLKIKISVNAEFYILKYQEFFDWFGTNEVGWRTFIEYYRFLPYVNIKYEVKDLFAVPSIYQKVDCRELVGSYHGWDFALPLCSADNSEVSLMTGKQRALNYALNSLWIWEERSKLLGNLRDWRKDA